VVVEDINSGSFIVGVGWCRASCCLDLPTSRAVIDAPAAADVAAIIASVLLDMTGVGTEAPRIRGREQTGRTEVSSAINTSSSPKLDGYPPQLSDLGHLTLKELRTNRRVSLCVDNPRIY
jgi:hypothetical protein